MHESKIDGESRKTNQPQIENNWNMKTLEIHSSNGHSLERHRDTTAP